MLKIFVQEADFDAGQELAALGGDGIGGIGCFIGIVREKERKLRALHLEHYPGMTERAMRRIAEPAISRWELQRCTLIHRVGRLEPGQNIVFIGAASAHREPALAATAFLIDWLKTAAPLWKREEYAEGGSEWVSARESDDQAAARWRDFGR